MYAKSKIFNQTKGLYKIWNLFSALSCERPEIASAPHHVIECLFHIGSLQLRDAANSHRGTERKMTIGLVSRWEV